MSDNGYLKRYASDWAKEKVHEALGEMLDNTILTYKKLKDVHVLHLPGIDMAETERVYLSRGIPPQNIVGVEREKDIYEEIQRNNRGTHVVHTTLEDYITKASQLTYDVISLDFNGPVSSALDTVLYEIRQKQTRRNFVLHTSNLLRRDAHSANIYVRGYVTAIEQVPGKRLEDISLQAISKWSDISKKLEHGNCSAEKTTSYSWAITGQFSGSRRETLDPFFRFLVGNEYEELKGDMIDIFKKILPRSSSMSSQHQWDMILTQSALRMNVESMLVKFLDNECRINYGLPKEKSFWIFCALADVALRQSKFFDPKNSTKYSYISESGAPMIGDIYFMSLPFGKIQAAQDICREVGYGMQPSFKIRNIPRLFQLIHVYAKECNKFLTPEDARVVDFSPRTFLGNASKPILTKTRFLSALDQARDEDDVKRIVAQVKETHRSWEGLPLPQWQAHWSMNTYRSQEAIAKAEENETVEHITEEQALDLLSSGIPPQEVWEAWPTSFTLPQLQGFKASITKERNAEGSS